MFEDSLMESSGKLKSKSKYWMIVTFGFNLAIIAVMILIPLLYPEALPKTMMTAMLTAPPPPPTPPPPPPPAPGGQVSKVVAALDAMTAPTKIPKKIDMNKEPPPPPPVNSGVVGAGMGPSNGAAGGIMGSMGLNTAPVVVAKPEPKPKPTGPVKISSGVAAGSIITKTQPTYPAIAKAAHVSGAVVLHAIISKTGTITSLQVVSGPEMLRGSAVDAVRSWRYKPYLLNGDPTEVDTTVTVNFSFGG